MSDIEIRKRIDEVVTSILDYRGPGGRNPFSVIPEGMGFDGIPLKPDALKPEMSSGDGCYGVRYLWGMTDEEYGAELSKEEPHIARESVFSTDIVTVAKLMVQGNTGTTFIRFDDGSGVLRVASPHPEKNKEGVAMLRKILSLESELG